MKIKVLGSEAACGASSTNGSNFNNSTHVRVFNDSTANLEVSIETSANVLIGKFHLAGGASEIVVKDPSDEIFAESTDVRGVGIAIEQ